MKAKVDLQERGRGRAYSDGISVIPPRWPNTAVILRFSAPNGQVVLVEAVGFDVSGISQVQWQQSARNLTDQPRLISSMMST